MPKGGATQAVGNGLSEGVSIGVKTMEAVCEGAAEAYGVSQAPASNPDSNTRAERAETTRRALRRELTTRRREIVCVAVGDNCFFMIFLLKVKRDSFDRMFKGFHIRLGSLASHQAIWNLSSGENLF
jgi:hypothetical protein